MKWHQEYDLVLLLGGTGSRMNYKPSGNKHLVEVGGKTVVEHIKEKIDTYESAVRPFANKYVVTNGIGVDEIMHILGQDYKYFYQNKPTGIPDAAFIPPVKNPFLLHLGDQFYQDAIGSFMEGFGLSNESIRTWLKQSKDTNHTVALIDGDGNIKRFTEKPNYPMGITGAVATGMYMLDPSVQQFVKDLPRNEKGENNMTDLSNIVMREYIVGSRQMQGYWYDVGNQETRKSAEEMYKSRVYK